MTDNSCNPEVVVNGLAQMYNAPSERRLGRSVVKFAHIVTDYWADKAADVYTRFQKPQQLDRSMFYAPQENTRYVQVLEGSRVTAVRQAIGKIITPHPEVWLQNTETVTLYDQDAGLTMADVITPIQPNTNAPQVMTLNSYCEVRD